MLWQPKYLLAMLALRILGRKAHYYVDKTRLLVELLCNDDMVTLITRPRRFGKSLMLSTLEEFFNICNNKEDTRTLRRAGSHGAGRPRGAIHVQVSSAAFFPSMASKGIRIQS